MVIGLRSFDVDAAGGAVVVVVTGAAAAALAAAANGDRLESIPTEATDLEPTGRLRPDAWFAWSCGPAVGATAPDLRSVRWKTWLPMNTIAALLGSSPAKATAAFPALKSMAALRSGAAPLTILGG